MSDVKTGRAIITIALLFYFGSNGYILSNPDLLKEIVFDGIFKVVIIFGIAVYLNPLFKMYTDKVKHGEESEKGN